MIDYKLALQIVKQAENAELDNLNNIHAPNLERISKTMLTGGRNIIGFRELEVAEYVKGNKFDPAPIGPDVALEYISNRDAAGFHPGFLVWIMFLICLGAAFALGVNVSNNFNKPEITLPPQKLDRPAINNNLTGKQLDELKARASTWGGEVTVIPKELLIDNYNTTTEIGNERVTR